MDMWVVAAAAGVGYLAQHWENFVKGRQSLSDASCGSPSFAGRKALPVTQQVQDKNCSADAVHKEKQCLEIYSEIETLPRDASMAEMASNSRTYDGNLGVFDGLVNNSIHSNPDLLPVCLSNGDLPGNKEGDTVWDDIDEMNRDFSLQASERDTGVSCGFPRKKSSLRSRRCNRQFIKPLTSLESCLMAQLYKDEVQMEEYTFSSICSPFTPVVRPFIVSDGIRIISRASSDSFSLPNKSFMDSCLQKKAKVYGVPPLPSVGSMKLRRKPKSKVEQSGKLSHSGRRHQKLHGSSQGAFLFGIGVSVGIMSSFLSNKREVQKLTEVLKQTENLVQDLQEELEMKDSLTVKELAIEDYESQDMQNDTSNNEPLHAFSPEKKHENYHKEYCDQKTDEESFSKIEAELEAELERLELNMTSSCRLDRKLSSLVELDRDDVPDMVEGELKADLFGERDGSQPYADQDGSGDSTPHSANYTVSPRELSLRLHEVIQSRLEQRIEELEIALQNSEKKVRIMESEQQMSHWREFSNSESGTYSLQGSPVAKQHADQPVVINLSGDALDAYNEAYDEFSKINELEEEEEEEEETPFESESIIKNSLKQQTFDDQSTSWFHNGMQNGKVPRNSFSGRRTAILFPTSQNDLISSGGNSSENDEMEELLIKHIVEKARKGSPVVLNAQKFLFSSHET